ncbi:MAG TPA: hypothetical protein VKP69_22255, partial [Isosphaeraceae bacterium]|nr:hypothetical protein [Isosphaeraceae bacterium]
LDADVVAVSPSSVYRVLRDAGLTVRHNCKPSLKGKGFDQPLKPHVSMDPNRYEVSEPELLRGLRLS